MESGGTCGICGFIKMEWLGGWSAGPSLMEHAIHVWTTTTEENYLRTADPGSGVPQTLEEGFEVMFHWDRALIGITGSESLKQASYI